jgi:hypothetical protein
MSKNASQEYSEETPKLQAQQQVRQMKVTTDTEVVAAPPDHLKKKAGQGKPWMKGLEGLQFIVTK